MPEPYEIYPKTTSPTARARDALALVSVDIGMMGFSLEDISQGKQGMCRMPIGERDSTKWGGRKYVRVKLTAMENVRANRDIIVANEQGEIKEHTPVELSFEKKGGGYQRVGETYPLPITASKAIRWSTPVVATAQGNTIIQAPSFAMAKIRVHYFCISNAQAAVVNVGMRFGTSGTVHHAVNLAANGGTINANLIDANWEGAAGESLYAYLTAAYASGVTFIVGYTEHEA